MSAPEIAARPADGRLAVRGARSLQARITASILLTAVSVLLLGCTLFMVEQHGSDRLMDARRLDQIGSALGDGFAEALDAGDLPAVQHQFQRLARVDGVVGATLVAPDGRVFARFPEGANAPTHAARSFTRRIPLSWNGRSEGELAIQAQPPAQAVTLSRYVAMGAALFFAAVAVALFLGRLLAARIVTPLIRLAQAMETVGQSGAFQVRIRPEGPTEVARLTGRFNVLMDRLQVKDTALRLTLAELVEARDAAEHANVAKSQFLANMSHEIRTPLNGVLAMAQILMLSPLEPTQREQVSVIHASGETLLSLLNDILDVSKIEAGKLELELAEFDPVAVVRAAAAAFSPLAERKGLTLDVAVAPGASGLREGDAARLRQILNNFVSNALKFTEHGGVAIALSGEGSDGAEGLRVEVCDTGMGIEPEKLPLLFQKFTQLDASTTRRFGGTGLGLAICRELAEMMGGSVSVRSEPGRGSTFTAVLPLLRTAEAPACGPESAEAEAAQPLQSSPLPAPAPEAASAAPEAEAAPAELRVLAAEDNPTNRLVLTTIMQVFGVDLVVAEDGQEAVERWRDGTFDVILMDIQMPRLDGVAATRRIRAEEQASGRLRTPILALSANALTHQVESYLAAGMDGHVAKPIELDKLQAALDSVFTASEAAPEAAAA